MTFRLYIGKNFFTVKVVKHWKGLPWKVVGPPSLKVMLPIKDVQMYRMGTWFSGEFVSVGLMVAPDELKGRF